MKKVILAGLIACTISLNAFAYQMTQKDADVANLIIGIVERNWIGKTQKYIDALVGYKKLHAENERVQAVITVVTDKLYSNLKPAVALAIQIEPTELQKSIALQMTTVCENSQTNFKYDYAENIWDWRWITFWIIWFTTWTFDWNILLHRYAEMNPNNNLKKYIPVLNAIDEAAHDDGGKNSDVRGLENFITDVNDNGDPLFKKAQLELMNSMYWEPAVKIARDEGVMRPLSLAFIYDMVVNHWEYWAKDIIMKTDKAMSGSPKDGKDEIKWLYDLIDKRYEFLKTEYPEALDRVDAYKRILNEWNIDLAPWFKFLVYWEKFYINGNVY